MKVLIPPQGGTEQSPAFRDEDAHILKLQGNILVLISEGGFFVKKKTFSILRLPECITPLNESGPVMIRSGRFFQFHLMRTANPIMVFLK